MNRNQEDARLVTAVDPGADQGWAMFLGPRCVAMGLGEPPWTQGRDQVCVIEKPLYRPDERISPKVLVELAMNAGEARRAAKIAGAEVVQFWPVTWKGSVPKKIMTERIKMSMPPEDLAILNPCRVAKGKLHNVIDAYGIGRYYLKQKGIRTWDFV